MRLCWNEFNLGSTPTTILYQVHVIIKRVITSLRCICLGPEIEDVSIYNMFIYTCIMSVSICNMHGRNYVVMGLTSMCNDPRPFACAYIPQKPSSMIW